MRAYVGNDATKILAIEKPRGPNRCVHAMRPQANRLNYVANRTLLHKITRLNSCFVFKPLTIHDGIDATGLFLHSSYSGQLFQRNDTGLVTHIVFTMLHGTYTYACTINWYCRAQN